MPPDYPLLIDNLKVFAPIIYQIISRAALVRALAAIARQARQSLWGSRTSGW